MNDFKFLERLGGVWKRLANEISIADSRAARAGAGGLLDDRAQGYFAV
ncbi:MAG TPA: hypothetical protein VNF29_13915 [Candidatus Binataceae bacterium]|nr:hypothetical protein [Candidatus Binataceae bacterium]